MDWEPAVSLPGASSSSGRGATPAPALVAAPVPAHGLTYLALDTNVLISDLDLVRKVHARLLRARRGHLLIPLQVVHELDGLKHKPGVADAASAATAWLLEQTRTTSRVHCESRDERLASLLAYGEAEARRPDDAVLSCCLWFARGARVSLWTADRNLALLAEGSGVRALEGGWGALLAAAGVDGDEEGMEVDAEGGGGPSRIGGTIMAGLGPEAGSEQAGLAGQEALQMPFPKRTPSPTKAPTPRRGFEDTGSLAAALAANGLDTPRQTPRATPAGTPTPPPPWIPPALEAALLSLLGRILDFLRPHVDSSNANTDLHQTENDTAHGGRDPLSPAARSARELTHTLALLYRPGYERPLARAAGGARTLELWLGPAPRPGSGRRRIRAAEAAEALGVLLRELGGLGVPLGGADMGVGMGTEELVVAIRGLE